MSLIDTVKKTLVPIHKEGWPFIGVFAAVTFAMSLFSDTLFWLGLALTLWCTYFFRDPQRVTPQNERQVISPADGVISAIGPAYPPRELGLGDKEMLRISVFMNVFSVHVNRAPVPGTIEQIAYKAGKFLNADMDKASSENERNGLRISTSNGEVGVVQIAGLVARRIVCWAGEGQSIGAGERFGLIRFGSRVDVFLPASVNTRVALGQTAIAGETILAEFGGEPSLTLVRIA